MARHKRERVKEGDKRGVWENAWESTATSVEDWKERNFGVTTIALNLGTLRTTLAAASATYEEFHNKSQVGRSARGGKRGTFRVSFLQDHRARDHLREFPTRLHRNPMRNRAPRAHHGELNHSSKVSEHFNRVRECAPDYISRVFSRETKSFNIFDLNRRR